VKAKTIILAAVLLHPHSGADEGHQTEPRNMSASNRTEAKATITVHHSESKVYDQFETSTLKELTLKETFEGDIVGESIVRALQVQHKDSASMVSLQRFIGRLADREGTFVLQGTEVIQNGRIKATWFVVPGSGTGGLAGLRGEGGFEGEFGKGSHGTLQYWFE